MRRCTMLILIASLAACSAATPPPPPAQPAKPTPTVFDDQIKTMDKARAVEGKVLDQKAQADKDIEKQSGD